MIDEVAHLHHADGSANVLYGVVDHRGQKRRPMVFTTNTELNQWSWVLHDNEPL